MPDPAILKLHYDAPLTDLHCHPPLKLYLLQHKRLHEPHDVDDADAPLSFRVDLPSLKEGGVRIALATTHIPEKALKKDCWPIGGLSEFVERARELFHGDPDEMTRKMIHSFEAAVAAPETQARFSVTVAHSRAELEAALAAKERVFLHAVEGAHSLRGGKPILDNLQDLFDRGVCLLTLAHFYDNGIAPPAPGVPDDTLFAHLGCFDLALNPDPKVGLHPDGKAVVQKMLELGIVVDLTHSNVLARQDVYKLWNAMPDRGKRPLVFSHVGLYEFTPFPKSHAMNVTQEDLDAIAASDGVVGVVFMNYWLTGKTLKGEADDMSHLLRTIDRLCQAIGEDHIALGSDFDGFTNPPRELKEPSDFPNLTDELLTRRRYGGRPYTEAQVKKFLGGNFMRVLEAGWGK